MKFNKGDVIRDVNYSYDYVSEVLKDGYNLNVTEFDGKTKISEFWKTELVEEYRPHKLITDIFEEAK